MFEFVIVLLTLLLVGQNGIRLVYFLKFFRSGSVARMKVRVILFCKLTVSRFNFVLRCGFRYAEYVVVIFLSAIICAVESYFFIFYSALNTPMQREGIPRAA